MFGAAVVRLEYIPSWSLRARGYVLGGLEHSACWRLSKPLAPGGRTFRKPPIVVRAVRLHLGAAAGAAPTAMTTRIPPHQRTSDRRMTLLHDEPNRGHPIRAHVGGAPRAG